MVSVRSASRTNMGFPSRPLTTRPELRSSAAPRPSALAVAWLQMVKGAPRSTTARHRVLAAASPRGRCNRKAVARSSKPVAARSGCRGTRRRPLTSNGTGLPPAGATTARRPATSRSKCKRRRKSRPKSPEHPGGTGKGPCVATTCMLPQSSEPSATRPNDTSLMPRAWTPVPPCALTFTAKSRAPKRRAASSRMTVCEAPVSSTSLAGTQAGPTARSTAT
mmetsp:Transcript_14747/g.40712  ORF Transcript_14747/g.40712 Transcript_14747/m.40712 type:complete len:221 (+) Transcript_14747:298-960(+)